MASKKKRLEPKKLSREAIRALQDVVGPERISEDRAIIEAYTIGCIDLRPLLLKHLRKSEGLPAAIILPETTEEVQAIVKIANRHKITLLPFTNGQVMSYPVVPGTLVIHFSRMDKILEIDEENMRVTIQPYVDYGTLQAELMKRGLWNGGSGWHSVIAKPASQFGIAGMWQTDLKYSGLSRNTLGLTVVLPTGEVMRVGSSAIAGTGRYSFTERFPGPNFLGLFKAAFGTRGIITEITLKVHPWVGGPNLPEDVGRPSIETYFKDAEEKRFDIPPPPKRHKVFWFDYPNMESLVQGVAKIARSGIGIGLNVTSHYNAPMCSRTLDEAERRVKEKFFPTYSGYIVIAGISSERQMKYEEKVLRKIVEETGGKLWSEEYRPEQLEAVAPWNLEFARNTETGMRTVRSWYIPNVLAPYAGYDVLPATSEMWSEVIEKIGAATIFSTMGTECPYGYFFDRGHQIETEVDQFPKRTDFEGLIKFLESSAYTWWWLIKKGYPGNYFAVFGEPWLSSAPEIGPGLYLFMRKLVKMMDPNNVMASHPKMAYTDEELKARLKKEVGGFATVLKWRRKFGFPPLEDVMKKLEEEREPVKG
jgi:hypothetical protein